MSDRRDELIARAFRAFNEQDGETMLAFLDPSVESHVAPSLANTGTWQGIEGFGTMLGEWTEAWSNLHIEVRDVEFATEDVALVDTLQTAVGVGSGVPVELEIVFLLEFAGERAVRLQIHSSRESALDAV